MSEKSPVWKTIVAALVAVTAVVIVLFGVYQMIRQTP
jgi:hypothetical protein